MPASRKRQPTTRDRARRAQPRPNAPLVTSRSDSPVRHQVERRSAVWLLYLSHLPRWVVAVVFAAVFLAGAIAPGPAGAAALLVVACALGLFAYVTWHSVRPGGRVVRVVVIAALVAWAITKLR